MPFERRRNCRKVAPPRREVRDIVREPPNRTDIDVADALFSMRPSRRLSASAGAGERAAGRSAPRAGALVGSEISHGRRVQGGVLALNRAAVERFACLVTRPQLEKNGVAMPGSVDTDVVGIESGRVQRAIPRAKQTSLQRGKRSPRQFIASFGHGRPMQILAAPTRLFDQGNNALLGPSRPARNQAIIDPGAFQSMPVRCEVICRRRQKPCCLRASFEYARSTPERCSLRSATRMRGLSQVIGERAC